MNHSVLRVAIGAALLVAACPPAPERAYSPADAEALTSLSEAMRVLAFHGDEWLGRRDDTAFTSAEFSSMVADADLVAAAARATGKQLAEGHPEGFRSYANGLEAAAVQWRAAAEAQDPVAATAALSAMKDKCAGCHSDFR